MYGSGVRIGMMKTIMMFHQLLILRILPAMRLIVCFVVVVGATTRGMAVYQFGLVSLQAIKRTASGSALSVRLNRCSTWNVLQICRCMINFAY